MKSVDEYCEQVLPRIARAIMPQTIPTNGNEAAGTAMALSLMLATVILTSEGINDDERARLLAQHIMHKAEGWCRGEEG